MDNKCRYLSYWKLNEKNIMNGELRNNWIFKNQHLTWIQNHSSWMNLNWNKIRLSWVDLWFRQPSAWTEKLAGDLPHCEWKQQTWQWENLGQTSAAATREKDVCRQWFLVTQVKLVACLFFWVYTTTLQVKKKIGTILNSNNSLIFRKL